MDLDFNLLETGCLFLAILVTAFTLQVFFCTLLDPA
jgi:Ca2+:H+ antiporter